MDLLRNPVRHHPWGSRTAIAELCGHRPGPLPEAELWLGAHADLSSRTVRPDGSGTSLRDRLQRDPLRQLGAECVSRWGHKLPFLLKVLAVEQPLSIQAHPSDAQAAEGFARENALGVGVDDDCRSYRDASSKPELLHALTEFHTLTGFRDPLRSVRLLRALRVPSLRRDEERLGAQPDSRGLRELLCSWFQLPDTTRRRVVSDLLQACARYIREQGEFSLECRTLLDLGAHHQHDAGVLACLLLNRVVIPPGESLFIPPGLPHVHLRGLGLEIQANSDNTLRGGLTGKHVDVGEFIRVLDFGAVEPRTDPGQCQGRYLTVFRTSAAEFELSRLQWPDAGHEAVELPSIGPRILLCTSGVAQLRTASARRAGREPRLVLRRGQSVWLPAHDSDALIEPVDPADGGVQVFFAAVRGTPILDQIPREAVFDPGIGHGVGLC